MSIKSLPRPVLSLSRALAFSLALLLSATVHAQNPAPASTNAASPLPLPDTPPPGLMMPVACTQGVDCWIVNYMDTDGSSHAADYQCGVQTYDAHYGTDFAVRDMDAVRAGVDVLAAAAGTVMRIRDGIEDHQPDEDEVQKMLAENRGCGNGVFIDHGQGWQTIYCHLKQGSILVKPDEKVTPGQRIAAVGQSGAAEFPHLHFGVFRDSHPIDPFTGHDENENCHTAGAPLWLTGLNLPYLPVSLIAAGFDDAVPSFDAIHESAHNPDTLPATAATLTFWGLMNSVADGDAITLRITGPDGAVFAERSIKQDRPRARQFYYVGKNTPNGVPAGTYTGTLEVVRTLPDGRIVQQKIGRAIYIQ